MAALPSVAQQEVTALDAIHKAALGKAACAGRVTEGVGTCISIHAPTWGATRSLLHCRSTLCYFNPRTHVGCDCLVFPERWRVEISIHAPTWGATLASQLNAYFKAFQSTHPRGVRLSKDGQDGRIFEFQSTHPRGVRPMLASPLSVTMAFQSTHPRGVRHR